MKYTRRIDPDPARAVHHVGHREAERPADGGAHDADHRALQQEDPGHRRRGEPHGPEDADLPGLVGNDHGQGADDVERGHDHDEEDNQSHGQLLELERAEEADVLGLPVERPVGIPQPLFQRLSDRWGAARDRPPGPRCRTPRLPAR